jgi:predicted  nucleic acid-binding Zn-ribbon protein
MPEDEQLKVTLEQELLALLDAREELLLEIQLDHTDVRTQWNRIDDALATVRAEVTRLDAEPGSVSSENAAVARRLLDEVKDHMASLKRRHWPVRPVASS